MANNRSSRSLARFRGAARTKVVWSALVASMTGVGGMLLLATGGVPSQAESGTTLSPLMNLSGPQSMDAIFQTREPIVPGRWTRIVIHHTGTPFASSESLAASHRDAGLEGLGYHFVVGNGAGMATGEIHVGYRWLDQLEGMSFLDEAGPSEGVLRIALAGNGDRRPFSREQVDRLSELVAALVRRCELSPSDVVLHREVIGTTSPGRLFPDAEFRERVRLLAR